MFFSNQEPNSRTMLVVPSETRSLSSVFFMVFIIGAIGLSLFWYFGTDRSGMPISATTNISQNSPPPVPQQANVSMPPLSDESVASSPAQAQDVVGMLASAVLGTSGDSGDIAADIADAVTGGDGQMAEANAVIEQQVEKIKNKNDGYLHSVHDVVGRTVNDSDGNKVGEVHDIIVDKETGIAKAVIVNKDGSYESDLSALIFDDILTQSPKGDVNAAVSDTEIKSKEEFVYKDLNMDKYLSLRLLHDGQVLDDTGAVAGQINAIIYENAEAQSIYFVLKAALVPSDKPQLYKLAYKDLNIVESPDGYDVKLTKKQTEDFATYLYGGETADSDTTTK